jgi:hypothetical protein
MDRRYSFEPPPVRFGDLLREVKKYRTQDILVLCNKFSRWAEEQKQPGPPYVDVRYLSYGLPAVGRVYITGSDLAGLARLALLHSTDQRRGQLTEDAFIRLISTHANLDDPFSHEAQKTLNDAYSFLLRTAWNQFPFQETPSRLIPRHLLMLESFNGKLLDVSSEWERLSSMTVRRFMEIGFVYASGAREHTFLQRGYASQGELAGRIMQPECERFLGRVATDYANARSLARSYGKVDPAYEKYAFNVLVRRPLVEIGQHLIAPVPSLLFRRITSGLLFDLIDAFNDGTSRRNPMSETLGILFEDFVGSLLRWTFGEGKVFHEPTYGRPVRRGPDWVVIDGESALLFECRTSRLSLRSKAYGDKDQVLLDMKRMFLETLEKFPAKVEDIASGRAGVPIDGVKSYLQIIVMLENDYVEPILREWASDALGQQWRPGTFTLMDVADIETLSAWHSSFPMQLVIREWHSAYKTSRMELGLFLRDWARENDLSGEHPLLLRVQDEFVSRLVGRDLNTLRPPTA